MKRARREQDKQVRRRAILQAARHNLAERAFSALSMAEVARRARLSKATLYLYFRTKEELALTLLEELLAAWFEALDRALDRGARLTPRGLAAIVIDELERQAPLARLLAVRETVLEHNIDAARARRWKTWQLGRMDATGARLERHFPSLAPSAGARLLLWINALVVGIAQMADPAPVVRAVLAEPQLEPLAIDFRRELGEALERLLAGLERAPRSQRGRNRPNALV